MPADWTVFGVIVLIIFGAIIGIYLKKKKGASIDYNISDDQALDDVMNSPE
jgi:hypothetical protein